MWLLAKSGQIRTPVLGRCFGYKSSGLEDDGRSGGRLVKSRRRPRWRKGRRRRRRRRGGV